MLLSHQVGCQTFADIRKVNGVVFPTYRSACQELGLLGDDMKWTYAFDDASVWASAKELRSLFAHMLLFCEISDPVALWAQQWRRMSDDIVQRAAEALHIVNLHVNDDDLQNYILYEIEILLNSNCSSSSLCEYGLPMPQPHLLADLKNRLLMEERNYDRVKLIEEHQLLVSKLNPDQQKIYQSVMEASLTNKQELLFVYGHGGTGKTFLWTTIISALRATGKIVLAVASSGIASLLLPYGRMAHSRFKIPLELTNDSICHVKKNTQLDFLLFETTLIIWDEAPMNDRKCFEALDKTLKDILDEPNCPFGGKSVLLGGDFRQTLPIKPKGSKMDIIASSIVESSLWKHIKICKLSQNMRLLQPDLSVAKKEEIEAFSTLLLNIGDGCIGVADQHDPVDTKWVEIPEKYLIQDDILPGETTIYLSADTIIPHAHDRGDTEVLYPPEYLNFLNFSGFPTHCLELKVGAPIMLLRKKEAVTSLPPPVIATLTSMKVTQYLGRLKLTATPASYIYIKPEIELARTMAEEFVLRDVISPVLKIQYERSYTVEVEKLRNRFTLAELLAQNPDRYMGVQFTCKASLTSIHEGLDWFYVACDKCRKKLQPRGDVLACEDHKVMKPKHLYLFTANMADDTAATKATFFDSAGALLLQTDCGTMINQLGYTDPHVLPVPLTNLQGRTKIFQMRFSISSRRGAIDFVVDRVFEDEAIPQDQTHPKMQPGTSTTVAAASATSITIVDPVTPAPVTPALATPSSAMVSSSHYIQTKRPRRAATKKNLFQEDSCLAETSMDSLKKQKKQHAYF